MCVACFAELLVGMAKEAASPDELSRKLTTWAEEIAAENPESDPMRHVFNLLCPDLVYKVSPPLSPGKALTMFK